MKEKGRIGDESVGTKDKSFEMTAMRKEGRESLVIDLTGLSKKFTDHRPIRESFFKGKRFDSSAVLYVEILKRRSGFRELNETTRSKRSRTV